MALWCIRDRYAVGLLDLRDPIQQRSQFCTGNIVLRTETAVRIAFKIPRFGQSADIFIRLMRRGHVAVLSRRWRGRIQPERQRKDLTEFRALDTIFPPKRTVLISVK